MRNEFCVSTEYWALNIVRERRGIPVWTKGTKMGISKLTIAVFFIDIHISMRYMTLQNTTEVTLWMSGQLCWGV